MRFVKEPLFHFLLLAMAIFAYYAWQSPSGPADDRADRIVIDDQDVNRLLEQYRSTWRRPPTAEELERLVDSLVREEVLVREARAMGLDAGDSVIRGRLTQKMDFLTTSIAQSMEPEESALQSHLAANPERFLQAGKLAFEQVFLGAQAEPQSVEELRAALDGGADPATLGQRSLLPQQVPLSPQQAIDATFGQGVFAALEELQESAWQGPIRSGYGDHLVRIVAREPARLPELSEIEEAVLFDWQREMSQTLSEAQVATLADRYEIVRPDLSDWSGDVLQ
ncbi:peptidylprolyl isomerase [Tropicimonas marinistellae]|uniref:peptidylprolyl isomerase n=1 Tax=Tropicimonas marinistellae TaxID=1739787 RepID=UPI00082E6F07|nr:peptidylprolyl isomerase [Tropicimonas marinistellae]